jgi:heat shock protein HtpX
MGSLDVKRIFLFIATNLAVIVLLNITLRLLGVDRILDAQGGLNFNALLVFAAVVGFGGAFFSLAISKWSAKHMTGARVIEQPVTATEQWLVSTVRQQAEAAGIAMPEVAVFDSPEPNAFATGATRNSSLVAVSTGLLQHMDRREVEAVLGHEVSHVANGDMVTMALIQGVVNTFVVFLARVVGHVVDRVVLRNEQGHGLGYFLSTIVAELVLGVLASIIVAWFSRQREYRADQGGARLAGKAGMIAALERLGQVHEESHLPDRLVAFGIEGRASRFGQLFMSHPPLEERIRALREAA